jgi:hypothetical protein
LRYYWQTYQTAPPSADLSGAEGLLDALVEALGDSAAATEGDAMAGLRVPPAVAPLPAERDRPGPVVFRREPDPARQPSPERPAAQPPNAAISLPVPAPTARVHRIEIAALLVHRHVFEVVDRPGRSLRPGRHLPLSPPPPPLAISAAAKAPLAIAAPTAQPRALAPPIAVSGDRQPRQRRTSRLGRSSAVTLGVAGLAVVLAMLLQHYALDRNLPAAAGDAISASAPQLPSPPPPPLLSPLPDVR